MTKDQLIDEIMSYTKVLPENLAKARETFLSMSEEYLDEVLTGIKAMTEFGRKVREEWTPEQTKAYDLAVQTALDAADFSFASWKKATEVWQRAIERIAAK